jgi:4-hydroxy-2-oxoheptanedioate aldolase
MAATPPSPDPSAPSPGEALRERLRAPGAAIGLWLALPYALTAEAAAAAGPDYVVVDEQHGAAGPGDLLAALHAVGVAGRPPLVRVGRNDVRLIGRALDLGAHGVIVPMVDDAEAAAAAVAACRYAPEGVRSHGVVRGTADPAPVCLVMVETRRALEQVDAIAATPGLDGIYVGPSDLARSFGLAPTRRVEHPPVLEGIVTVRAACAREGLVAGVHCLSGEDAGRFARAGLDLVTAGSELVHLRAGLASALAAARGG